MREPLTTAGRRPDFGLTANARQYFLEVKVLGESDAEAFADEFHEELLHDIPHELFRPTQIVTIRASATYAAMAETEKGLNRLDAERERIREAFLTVYAAVISAGVAPGVYDVAPFGAVTVEAADPERGGNEVGVDFIAPSRPGRRAVRGARLFARACAQLPPEGIGVVLVGAREGVPLRGLLKRVTDWAAKNRETARNCDVLVVRTPVRLPEDEMGQAVAMATIGKRRLTDKEVGVLRFAARPRHGVVPDPWGADEPRKLK